MKLGPEWTGSFWPFRTGPDRTGPDRTGPDRTGPDRTGPDRTGPDRTGPDRTGPDRTHPDYNVNTVITQTGELATISIVIVASRLKSDCNKHSNLALTCIQRIITVVVYSWYKFGLIFRGAILINIDLLEKVDKHEKREKQILAKIRAQVEAIKEKQHQLRQKAVMFSNDHYKGEAPAKIQRLNDHFANCSDVLSVC